MKMIEGPEGDECYLIEGPGGAEVTFTRHGGHLISWKTSDGKERLFLSQLSKLGPPGAIRGGVPVIFPQFNENGPFGRHGFARKAEWTPNMESETLILRSSEETLALWPFAFQLQIGATPNATGLDIELHLTNTGDEAFSFQAALHTYFGVDDVTKIQVEGLADKKFDSIVPRDLEMADRKVITFGHEVDRAYPAAGDTQVLIKQLGKGESFAIESEGFPDFVVWNPGPDHQIADLDDWQKFVCVESAQVQLGNPLQPGQKWLGKQKISLV